MTGNRHEDTPIRPVLQAQMFLVEVGRVQHYSDEKQATRVKLTGVQGEPFGLATPQASMDMLIVNRAAQRLLHDLPIGQKLNIYFEIVEE